MATSVPTLRLGPRVQPHITLDVNNDKRYYFSVIKSFRDPQTEKIFNRLYVRRFSPDLQRVTRRKLLILDAAERLKDLRIPPGNRLEELRGTRKGQHSIRINDQWRICFRWTGSDAEDVEITDYH